MLFCLALQKGGASCPGLAGLSGRDAAPKPCGPGCVRLGGGQFSWAAQSLRAAASSYVHLTSKAPQPRPPSTTAKILQCVSVDELKSLVLGYRAPLKPAELACVFQCLSRLHLGSLAASTAVRVRARRHAAALAARLLDAHGGLLHNMDATELGQVLLCVSRLRCPVGPVWLQEYLCTSLALMPAASPRQLATELRSLSQVVGRDARLWQSRPLLAWLQRFMDASEPLLSRFGPEDLTMTITAVCHLAVTPYRPPSSWMLQFSQAVGSHARSLECRQLARVLAAFARLQFKPDRDWAAAFQKQVQSKVALFDSSDLVLLLVSVADGRPMKLLEAGLVGELVQEALRKLARIRAASLGRLLYALAALGARVEPPLLDAALDRMQDSLPKARPAILADICWSLPALGHTPSAPFLQALEAATLQKMRAFKRSEMVALITGMALLRWRPGWEWLEKVAHHALDSCPALKQRAGVLHAMAGLGCPGTPAVVRLVADTMAMADKVQQLQHLTGAQQVELLWGAVHLAPSHVPHSWLHKWCVASRSQFSNLCPSLWCDVLQAMGHVSFRPGSEWLAMAAVCCQSSFHSMQPWELAGCVTGLAGVGYCVSRRWSLDLQDAALSQLDGFTLEEQVQLGWGLALMRQPLTPPLQQQWQECVLPAVMRQPQTSATGGHTLANSCTTSHASSELQSSESQSSDSQSSGSQSKEPHSRDSQKEVGGAAAPQAQAGSHVGAQKGEYTQGTTSFGCDASRMEVKEAVLHTDNPSPSPTSPYCAEGSIGSELGTATPPAHVTEQEPPDSPKSHSKPSSSTMTMSSAVTSTSDSLQCKLNPRLALRDTGATSWPPVEFSMISSSSADGAAADGIFVPIVSNEQNDLPNVSAGQGTSPVTTSYTFSWAPATVATVMDVSCAAPPATGSPYSTRSSQPSQPLPTSPPQMAAAIAMDYPSACQDQASGYILAGNVLWRVVSDPLDKPQPCNVESNIGVLDIVVSQPTGSPPHPASVGTSMLQPVSSVDRWLLQQRCSEALALWQWSGP